MYRRSEQGGGEHMSSVLESTVSQDPPASEHEPTVTREDLYDLLGNCRRRYVIDYLREHREPTSLDTLARRVAARENNTSVAEVTTAERKRVYTSLQQTHLPRMDEVGVVEFDKERGVITPADQLAEFSLHLDVVSANSVPQSVIYLALSGVSVALVVGVVAGAPLLRSLSPFWLGGIVVALFTVVATIHHFRDL